MTTKPVSAWRRCGRWLLLAVLAPALALGGFALVEVSRHNLHIVSADRVYRSAQMNGDALAAAIRDYHFKSIINLRGGNAGNSWYQDEINTARQLNVQHFDFALSASEEVSDEQIEKILATIQSAPKPVLIHCHSGSDRTGLIGAVYLYRCEGQSADAASHQLALFYGHVPYLFWRDTIAMDHSFWRYVSDHAPSSSLSSAPAAVLAHDAAK